MYGTDDANLENSFEKPKVDQAALDQKAEAWQGAMSAAPEFAEGAPAGAEISMESGETVDVFDKQFGEAAKILNYGFETASQGLGENGTQIVLNEIRNANPDDPRMFVGIYRNLNLSSEAAATVSADLKKQKEANFQNDGSMSFEESFRSTVKNLQSIIQEVETGAEFAEMQNGARASGMDTITFLLKDEKSPSLSVFLARVNEARAQASEIISPLETEDGSESEAVETSAVEKPPVKPDLNVENVEQSEAKNETVASSEILSPVLPEIKKPEEAEPEISALNPAEALEEKGIAKVA